MGILAAGNFNADAEDPGFLWQRGFASDTAFVRNGAGDYTLTLQNGLNDATQGLAQVTIKGATPGCVAVTFPTTTTIRVKTTDPAQEVPAADLGFYIEVHEIGPA